jgi:hypothetical protein
MRREEELLSPYCEDELPKVKNPKDKMDEGTGYWREDVDHLSLSQIERKKDLSSAATDHLNKTDNLNSKPRKESRTGDMFISQQKRNLLYARKRTKLLKK